MLFLLKPREEWLKQEVHFFIPSILNSRKIFQKLQATAMPLARRVRHLMTLLGALHTRAGIHSRLREVRE